MQIKINTRRAHAAMTMLLLGRPGELIPAMSPDKGVLDAMTPGVVTDIQFEGKTLTVFIGCLISHVETRDLWIMMYLQKMK